MHHLLLATIALPAITAALLVLLMPPARVARWVALGGTVCTLAAAIALANGYQKQQTSAAVEATAPQILFTYNWLSISGRPTGPLHVNLEWGVDGLSIIMLLLTAGVWICCVLAAWDSIEARPTQFYGALLLLEAGLLGFFCAFDLVSFYVFFEFTLLPLFALLGIFGGLRRRYAGLKFLLMALAGSFLTLLGLAALVALATAGGLDEPCSLPALASWFRDNPLSTTTQTWLMLLIAGGLVVKTPLFPVHTWMPLFHEQSHPSGAVDMAAVLLKLGVYGFFRLCLPLLPDACLTVGMPLFVTLALVGIIYGSLCALAQRDIKLVIAYGGLVHMGFSILGLFALNEQGITGGLLQVVNSGLATAGLFLLVGFIERRYGHRQLGRVSAIASRFPLLAGFFVLLTMASIGLPGLNGFVGEFLALAGMFRREPLLAVLGATGLILGAWYTLTMVQHLLFGPASETESTSGPNRPRDLNAREFLALAPLAAACIWLGVQPQPVIDTMRPAIESVAELYEAPTAASLAAATPDAATPLVLLPAR